jgi:hypothetical protein
VVYLRRLLVLAPLVFRGGKAEKGESRNLSERPEGCFAPIAPVPWYVAFEEE